jgi:CTP:molybdopterin cytidylyltransferase MocA
VAADFWRRVEQQRKKPLRVIGALGWITVLRYILGRLSLDQSLRQLSGRLGVNAGTVLLPYAQAAIDVDTVADWQFVQKITKE